MKYTYDFDSKAKARGKLKEFIETVYTSPYKRKNLKVLTMCGHENVEFDQVWDPLGISRENIQIIESDYEAYNLIKQNNLGCRITDYPMSDLDFLSRTNQNFDIINLDYMGTFDKAKRDSLRYIAGRRILKNKGLLATWYSGRRENGGSKEWFETEGNSMIEPEVSWKSERGNIILRMIWDIFSRGITNIKPHSYLSNDIFIKKYKKEYLDLILKEENGLDLIISHTKKDPRKELIWEAGFGKVALLNVLSRIANDIGCDYTGIEEMLYQEPIESLISSSYKSYKYHSDNGCPMYVDINYFKTINTNILPKLIFKDNFNVFTIKLPRVFDKKELKKVRNELEKIVKNRDLTLGIDTGLPKRVYLGSSTLSKSKKKDEKIDLITEEIKILTSDEKDAIRALNREGYKPVEIYNTFYSDDPLVSRHMVGSICAWNKIWAKQNS